MYPSNPKNHEVTRLPPVPWNKGRIGGQKRPLKLQEIWAIRIRLQISWSWRAHWHNLNTLFSYPKEIRKAIYTTNAIESLNSVIRKAIKKRKLFPTDNSAKKVIYLAIQAAAKKWTMPIRNWKLALNRFMIEFEDRLAEYI